jgi:ribonuclease-3
VVDEGGEDHARVFRASCTLDDPAVRTEGEGSSRRAAEQQAAEAALRIIEA